MAESRRGIRIAHRMSPRPTEQELAYFQQMDIDSATIWTTIEDNNETYMVETKALLADRGILVNNIGILDLHCDPALTLGLAEQDEKIEQYQRYLRALGKAGIGYTTYAHMANIKMLPYYQTGMGPTRGGVLTRKFDQELAETLPNSHGREYSDDEIWASLTRFLRAVLPVAEEVGVRIGLHPDDPPLPALGGIARVIRNVDGYERALEIADSPNFGICHCVGTWAEGGVMMGKDPVEMIRYFGGEKIWKIHFRNVDAPLPLFKETFVDNGYVDMYEVLRALREVNFDGAILPDHVPGDATHTSYTLGYMRALRDRVNAEAAAV
jgi:mannonate dehydratase